MLPAGRKVWEILAGRLCKNSIDPQALLGREQRARGKSRHKTGAGRQHGDIKISAHTVVLAVDRITCCSWWLSSHFVHRPHVSQEVLLPKRTGFTIDRGARSGPTPQMLTNTGTKWLGNLAPWQPSLGSLLLQSFPWHLNCWFKWSATTPLQRYSEQKGHLRPSLDALLALF